MSDSPYPKGYEVEITLDVPNLPTYCDGVTVNFCPQTGMVTKVNGKLPTRGLPRRIFQRVQNGAGYFGFVSLTFGNHNVSVRVRDGLRGTRPEAFLREAI